MSEDNIFNPEFGVEVELDTPIEAPAEAETATTDEAPVEEVVVEDTPSVEEAVVDEPEDVVATTEETVEEPEPAKLLGRFNDVEALEQGYTHLQGWATQQAQARAELERQNAAVMAEMDSLKAQIDVLIPFVQQQALEQDPDLAERLERDRVVQEEIARQTAAVREQMSAEAQAAQDRAIWQGFVSSHPDADLSALSQVAGYYAQKGEDWELGTSPADLEVAYTLTKEPQVAATIERMNLYPDANALAVAREVADDPELQTFLALNPQYVAEPATGIPLARKILAGSAAAQTIQRGAQQLTQEARQARQDAYTTPGHSGAPVDSAPNPDDLLAAVAALSEADSKNGFISGQF